MPSMIPLTGVPLNHARKKLLCAIEEEQIIGGSVFGYQIGSLIDGSWSTLIISPIIFSSIKEASRYGEKALIAAEKAYAKRRAKRSANKKANAYDSGPNAS